MRDLTILFVHLIVTLVRLSRPGGHRTIIAESLLLKHQPAILNRFRNRAPNLRPMDRVIAGLCAGFRHRLITVIGEMKRRNPRFGCRRIAEQIAFTFDLQINKDIVRRVLTKHYRPEPGAGGPSWLTFLGHSKDSLWSVDLFSLRVAYPQDPLGDGSDESVPPSDHRFRGRNGCSGWAGGL